MDYGTFQLLQDLQQRITALEANTLKIISMLKKSQQKEIQIMAKVQDVLTAVQEETTVTQSIITLLDQIKAALDAAGTDEAMLDQVKAMIDANKTAMADAVVRNTPVPTGG